MHTHNPTNQSANPPLEFGVGEETGVEKWGGGGVSVGVIEGQGTAEWGFERGYGGRGRGTSARVCCGLERVCGIEWRGTGGERRGGTDTQQRLERGTMSAVCQQHPLMPYSNRGWMKGK